MSWPTVKIGDIFDVARGGSPRPIQNFITDDPDGINWIMISDTKADSKYITSTAKKIRQEGVRNSRKVFIGDFLLTNSMSFGRPYILKTGGCIHDGWLVLSPKAKESIWPDFFYYYLGSPEIKLMLDGKAAGAVVKNLNSEIVRQLEIRFPPLETQKQIAAILEKADQLRKDCQQMEQELNSLAQSVFMDMFGDPVTNLKGWKRVPLSALVSDFQGGKSLVAADGGSDISKYRILKISAVTWGEFKSDETKPLPDDYEPPDDHFVRKGDLLFSRANTTELVGATAMVFDTPENLVLPDKLWRFVWKDESVLSPVFMWRLLCQPEQRIEISKLSSGSGGSMKNISKGKLNEMEIILPPLELQKKFEHIYLSLRMEYQRNQELGVLLENSFSALMQKAFKGELRLENA